ncbi:hypothetical protein [Streptomyces canus]|uniref:hypothetical protein n=1 Tax=Streptomyces canus TaxID=58343 RepID=UPI00382854D9
MEPVAEATGSVPHTASTSSPTRTWEPSASNSTASTARCWGGPRSTSTAPRHALTGPSTANRTCSRTQISL